MANLTDEQLELACRFLAQVRKTNPEDWQQYRNEILARVRAIQADKAIAHSLE